MKIKLYKRQLVVLAENLTWWQVSEAVEKARESEAGKLYHFNYTKTQPHTSDINPWSLIAMPKVVFQSDRGEDVSGWVIEIQDYKRRAE